MHASSRAVPSLHPSQSPNDSNDCSLSAPRSPSLVGCGRAEHAFWALLMMAEEPVHIVTVFRDLLGSSGPFLFSVSRLLQQVSSTPPEILRYSLVRLPACALYRPEHARGARDHSWRSSDLHLRPVGTSLPLAPVCADSQYAHCELAQRAQTCLKQGQPGSRGQLPPWKLVASTTSSEFSTGRCVPPLPCTPLASPAQPHPPHNLIAPTAPLDCSCPCAQDSSHERQVRGKKAWSRFCFVLQPADGRERARTVRPSV